MHTKAVLILNRFKNAHERRKELCDLTHSAGLRVMGTLWISQKIIHHKTFLGSGKVNELKNLILETSANVVIFNDSLTSLQIRNLSNLLKTPILERSQLILKIFSERANSYAGKLQVEAAQKIDELSRIRGAWLGSLSRQGGGLGARGPGEKALETDRRQIQQRLRFLRRKLKALKKDRKQQRKLREKKQTVRFALIGYTNSGKTSLLNYISRANAPVKNQLFLTLDPLTRKIFIPKLSNCVLTDTVGFIQDLPPHLIEAFKATLEESFFSDVLLHVIDSSNPNIQEQIKTVHSLITDFGWDKKPIVYVYNKIDLISKKERVRINTENHRFYAFVSALSGKGLSNLLVQMRKAYLSLNKSFFSNVFHKKQSLDLHT